MKPLRSLRSTIAAIHDQGGLAIPAHPLVPYPLCAQGFVLRRLLADEPRFRPDAIEAFNPTTLGRPWHARVVRFAEENGLATVGNSDAHALEAVGSGYSTFPGRTAEDLRAAILEGTDRITTARSTGRPPSWGRSAGSSASTVATRARTSAAGSEVTAPAATSATRPTSAAAATGSARGAWTGA